MNDKYAAVLFSILFYALPSYWFCRSNKKIELKFLVFQYGKFPEAKEKF